jgi:glycerol uptake facilitator-like aquaporin
VILWFAGLAVLMVWQVFRDTAIDYRLVIVGAMLPDVIDGIAGGRAQVLHSVVTSALLLVIVMLATRHRRAARRRLLAIPIGTFLHLVLDGMWAKTAVFWWPLFGAGRSVRLPTASRGPAAIVVQELLGAAALWWCWRRFQLGEPERRAAFLRTGRFGRDLAGPPRTPRPAS